MIYFYPNKPLLVTIDSPIIKTASEDSNWWAEVKKNGSRLCLWKNSTMSASGFVFWNRHKTILNYIPTPEVLDELNSLNLPENTHIDAELLHFKTKHVKNFIYVYDIYQYKDKQIFDDLFTRRKMLEEIFSKKKLKHIQLAPRYQLTDFKKVFEEVILKEENEGLVLKNGQGRISWNMKTCVEVVWQQKVRKPSNSYRF